MLSPFLDQAIWIVVVISGIPLLIATALSLVAAVLQAATQVQEQSLTFVLKIGTVGIVLVMGGSVFASMLIDFFRFTFESIRYLG